MHSVGLTPLSVNTLYIFIQQREFMVSAYIIITLDQAPRPHAQQNATTFGLLDSYMYMKPSGFFAVLH